MRNNLFTYFYLLVGLLIFAGCGQGTVQPSVGIDDVDIEANASEVASEVDK